LKAPAVCLLGGFAKLANATANSWQACAELAQRRIAHQRAIRFGKLAISIYRAASSRFLEIPRDSGERFLIPRFSFFENLVGQFVRANVQLSSANNELTIENRSISIDRDWIKVYSRLSAEQDRNEETHPFLSFLVPSKNYYKLSLRVTFSNTFDNLYES